MILYFSGTGNSEYVAKRIGRVCNDDAVSLFEKIRSSDYSQMHSDTPWVVVVPTYAWRIPRIVQGWLDHTSLSGNRNIYFVMTCGGNIGNAGKYLKKVVAAKNLYYMGCAEVVMPENYIALFMAPAREDALDIIERAESAIDRAALSIKSGEPLLQPDVTVKDRISSGIVNDIFYPMFVHAKKFYATDACISCGKCAKVCPLSNIQLDHGKPVWGKNCTHCMACICRCPTGAIEYGRHSRGLVRYVCPKSI